MSDAAADASRVARAAVGMGAATAVSRALGAVRVLVIAAVLGPTFLGNAFQGSNSFSTVLFELLAAGALSSVLVPTFVDRFDAGDEEGAERLAGGLLGLALALLGAVAVVGVVAAPALASLLTSAVDDPAVRQEQEELTTFLLRFFVPQIVLYPIGAVATAVLNARRVFALPALAPIGNTVVVVASMLVFRAMAGPDPGLDLTEAERLVLAAGGTLGVAAFVAIPAVALSAQGFRLRPRLAWRDAGVRRLLGQSGWGAVQHAAAAVLLLTALVVGGAVEGGVLAFQVAWVLFLAPYAILGQPIHTTILPELARDAVAAPRRYAATLRWAIGSMAVVLVPVGAAGLALAVPVARVLAFGDAATPEGIELIAAALASLSVGLPVYGTFLLLSRAWYALDDARTPGLAALGSSVVGSIVMVVLAAAAAGAGVVVAMGAGHSVAFALGTVVLVAGVSRRTGPVVPTSVLTAVAVSVVLAAGAWLAMAAWDPAGRAATLAALAVIVAVGGAIYVGLVRRLGGFPPPFATATAVAGVGAQP